MFKRFDKVFGIDLGTSNTVIVEQGKGVVLSEPSVVAFNTSTGDIAAVGEQALAMIGRAPSHIKIDYPLSNGVIANFELTTLMLKHFMKKVQGRTPLIRGAQVYISVPCNITNVQKRAVEDTMVHKGARKAVVVDEPLVAAIGAGLPIHEPVGHLVLTIGGGTSQAAILSMGGIVASHTTKRAGMTIDRDIMAYVKREHNLVIGERTAEEIKIQIATVDDRAEERTMQVRGRNLVDGLPCSITISSKEIYDIIDDFLKTLVETIRTTMELCPPELAGDVVEQGVLLCGGGALLMGIEERIREEIGVPVYVADNPLECTAIGAGKMQ